MHTRKFRQQLLKFFLMILLRVLRTLCEMFWLQSKNYLDFSRLRGCGTPFDHIIKNKFDAKERGAPKRPVAFATFATIANPALILRTQGLHWWHTWDCFFALAASKILHQLSVFHVAFLFSLLPFLSKLPTGIKNTLVTKQTNFAQPSRCKWRRVLAKATAFVISHLSRAEKFSRGKEITEQCYYYDRIAIADTIWYDSRRWVDNLIVDAG